MVVGSLLDSSNCWGQYSATTTLTGTADNTNGCTTTTSTNCWIDESFGKTFAQVATASDTTAFAVDFSQGVWRFNYTTSAWDVTSFSVNGSVSTISVASSTEILVVKSNTTGANVFQLIGSTWTQLGSKNCQEAVIAADGSAFCIDRSNVLYYYTTPNQSGGVWTQIATGAASVAINNADVAVMVSTSNVAYMYTPALGYFTSLSLPFTPDGSTSRFCAIGNDASLVFVDTSGNVRVSHDLGNTWWTMYMNGLTPIQVNSPVGWATFILDSNYHVQHLNNVLPLASEIISGQQNCPSCSPTTVHTGKATLTYPHHLGVGYKQGSTQAQYPIAVEYDDSNPLCDIMTFGNDECQFTTNAIVNCPIAGTLINVNGGSGSSVPNLASKYYQKYKITGSPAAWKHIPYIGWGALAVPVNQWCVNSPFWPQLFTVFLEWWTTSSTQPTLPDYIWATIETAANGSIALGTWYPTTNTTLGETCTGIPYGVASIYKPPAYPSNEDMLALAINLK